MLFERRELVEPALLTRMSSVPNALLVSATTLFTWPALVKIALDGDGLAALAGDLGHDALGGFLAGAVIDDNGGAFRGEAERDLGADTLGCAGHQRHFAFESSWSSCTPTSRRYSANLFNSSVIMNY